MSDKNNKLKLYRARWESENRCNGCGSPDRIPGKKLCYNCSRINTISQQARYEKAKQRAVDYKGGECFRCHQVYPLCVMDFHHINPETKAYDFAGSNLKKLDWPTLKSELDKCILVCANCHRIIEQENHPKLDKPPKKYGQRLLR